MEETRGAPLPGAAMTERQQLLRRAILATSVAYVVAHHGSGARTIARERLGLLLSLRARENDRDDLTAPDDLGAVIVAASRVCGMFGAQAATLGDPEFYLRTAVERYFAGQSNQLATKLGVAA
jgi:hypothetical protein